MKPPEPGRDYYEILGINRDATILDIEAAWQKKERECGLSEFQGLGDEVQAIAKAEIERIHAAYETLKEPTNRKAYDRMLASANAKQTQPTHTTRLERFMSKQAEIANDRAIEDWEQNRFEEAIAQWEEIVRKNPNLAEIHYNLGNAYAHQSESESAIEALKRALSIDPTLLEAYNKLGVICYKQGNLELAAASWKQALKIDPNFEEARHNIGLIQNVPQFDVDNEIPAYQHVTADDAKHDGNAGTGDNDPTWRNRIRQGWSKFRKK